jgi:hypothetical protein
VFIGIFLATQLFIFGFTDQGTWADTYTAINRLPLHFVPALIYAALIINQARAWQLEGEGKSLAPAGLATRTGVSQLWPAALLAAVLVVAGSLVFLARGLPENPAEARAFAGPDLNFVMGSGSTDGDRVVIDGFAEGYALLSSGPVAIQADDYRFLHFDLDRGGSGASPALFWRLSDAPEELVRVPVWKSGAVTQDLSAEDHWRGEVTEFGFLFEESGGPVTLGSVELAPDTLPRRTQLAWRNWTAFEPWSQKSINFLQGGTSKQLIRLPVLAIAWLALTVLLVWLQARFWKKPDAPSLPAAVAVIFLAAWMTLDLRWTANSLAQARHTTDTYWGASEEERLERTLDGEIYRYIRRLKEDVLPQHPSRILIVGDDDALDYFLRRAKYHLLPHSAYVTRQFPNSQTAGSRSFVIYFGNPEKIKDAHRGRQRKDIVLTMIDSDDTATVFRIEARKNGN